MVSISFLKIEGYEKESDILFSVSGDLVISTNTSENCCHIYTVQFSIKN